MDNEPTNEKEVCSEPRATAPPAKYLFCSFYLFQTKKANKCLPSSKKYHLIDLFLSENGLFQKYKYHSFLHIHRHLVYPFLILFSLSSTISYHLKHKNNNIICYSYIFCRKRYVVQQSHNRFYCDNISQNRKRTLESYQLFEFFYLQRRNFLPFLLYKILESSD
ncbi:hypothetical protein IGJ63_001915 [Enterococcus sp. DIV1375a]